MLCWPLSTNTQLPWLTIGTLLPTTSASRTTQDGSAANMGHFSCRFMASKGSEVTDLQTPDLLREAGMPLKAWHNFLTLLAHECNTGWHTVLNRPTQTEQDRVLSSAGGSVFSRRAGGVLLTRNQGDSHPRRPSH